MQANASRRIPADVVPLAALLAWFILASLLIGPVRNVPVIDDWAYAWSVERLLKAGRLEVLDFSAVYPIAQSVWGSLFAWALGFSFGSLRISTIVLGVLACAFLYGTLRLMDFDRASSSVGMFALAVNPVFFFLSFSFMTDVPFLCLMNGATLCYVAAFKKRAPRFLWLGGLVSTMALLERQIGVVLPAVALAAALIHPPEPRHRARYLVPLVASAIVMPLVWLAVRQALGVTEVEAQRLQALSYVGMVDLSSYFRWSRNALVTVIFFVSPILLGLVGALRQRSSVLIASAVAAATLIAKAFDAMSLPVRGGTWTWAGLGGSRALIVGPSAQPGWVDSANDLSDLVLALVLGLLAVGLVEGMRNARRKKPDSLRPRTAELLVLGIGAAQLVLINLLWLYDDRYYLVLMPAGIVLALMAAAQASWRRTVTWTAIAAFALISVAGTWDALRFNQACLDLYNNLRAKGLAPRDIDGGYALNGWMLYAHPENLPPGADRAYDVEFVTARKSLPCVIANTPLPDYAVVEKMIWSGIPGGPPTVVYAVCQSGFPP